MWSIWRCVSSTSTRVSAPGSSSASGRRPVPASSTTTHPSGPVKRTHDVLPPYRAVEGPGVASEPRTPYSVTFTARSLPEHCHGAQQLPLLADERIRCDLDLQPDAVAAAEHQPMSVGGPALLQRDLQRVSGIPWLRQGIVAQLDEAIGLLPLDASRLLEPDPEHPFSRLVVEDHRARRIHEDDWHGQVAAQLPREDHLHRLLGHRSLRRRGTNHVRGSVLLNTRAPWSHRPPPRIRCGRTALARRQPGEGEGAVARLRGEASSIRQGWRTSTGGMVLGPLSPCRDGSWC